MALRSDEAKFLDTHPTENHVLNVIARRARRTKCKLTGLEVGECFIGNKGLGLTEQQYRTAKKNLKKWGFVNFKKGRKATDTGTVATLLNTMVYDINQEEGNGKGNGSLTEQVTESQRKGNGSLTTNNNVNKDNNVNNENNVNKSIVVIDNEIDAFEIFYSSGLVKKSKAAAMKSFAKLVKSEKQDPLLIANRLSDDIKARIESKQFGIDNLHPSTYLNNRRWEDDIEQPQTGGLSNRDTNNISQINGDY
jgi:hypothetical protein